MSEHGVPISFLDSQFNVSDAEVEKVNEVLRPYNIYIERLAIGDPNGGLFSSDIIIYFPAIAELIRQMISSGIYDVIKSLIAVPFKKCSKGPNHGERKICVMLNETAELTMTNPTEEEVSEIISEFFDYHRYKLEKRPPFKR